MPSTDRSTGRFRLLLPLGLSALVGFAVLRSALLLTAWGDVELGAGTLLRLYGTGLLYDLAFLAYAAVPLVLYLMALPQRLYRSRGQRLLTYGLCYALLYGLLFVLAAEWVFWGEFGARFNFIAVDYLVYSDEVLGNIRESYPIGALLGGLGLLALALLWALRRPMHGARDGDSLTHAPPARRLWPVGDAGGGFPGARSTPGTGLRQPVPERTFRKRPVPVLSRFSRCRAQLRPVLHPAR